VLEQADVVADTERVGGQAAVVGVGTVRVAEAVVDARVLVEAALVALGRAGLVADLDAHV
jgi:hypothetical protein